MSKEPTSVPEIFKRGLALARENEGMSLKDLRRRLYDELKDSPMPPLSNPAVQSSCGASASCSGKVRFESGGIQREDWREIINGVAMSLDQTLRYERERGTMG